MRALVALSIAECVSRALCIGGFVAKELLLHALAGLFAAVGSWLGSLLGLLASFACIFTSLYMAKFVGLFTRVGRSLYVRSYVTLRAERLLRRGWCATHLAATKPLRSRH